MKPLSAASTGANFKRTHYQTATGHWIIFTLDELRSRSALLRADSVEGAPPLPDKDAELFVWAAFAAARGYAVAHGLIAGS